MKKLVLFFLLIFILVGCKSHYNNLLPKLSNAYQERIVSLPINSFKYGCRLDTLPQFSDINLQLKTLYPDAKVFFLNIDHIFFFLERNESLMQSKSLFFAYQLGDSGLTYDIEQASRFVDFDVTKVSFRMDRVDDLHYYILMKDNSDNGL